MMDDLLLALDFGGTKLSVALFSVAPLPEATAKAAPTSLKMRDRRRVFTPPDADSAYELSAVLAAARKMLAGRAPAAVGVSFGGPVDFAAGVVHLSHHVPGWENIPLHEVLEEEFGAPAVVDNDANAAALGEHRFGAGRGLPDLMYITVSTGVGGGWVLGGRPWRGHDGLAGEIGHMVVDPAGPLCLCGRRGCVERLASGPYMAADAEEQLRVDPTAGPILRELWGLGAAPGTLTGRIVAEAAEAGDELALSILLRGARSLGVGIGNAANLINPQRFILGGGVTKAGAIWWDEVRRAARATALPQVSFDVVPAELGDDAPLWGAITLIMNA
jgi:glucokinase